MSKILIVDDEEMMLMIARRILSTKYETVTAETGAEAIKIFEHERPDMVLSDLMMPEMDGYELHRRLQEISTEPVPIMFMTADDSEESESKGFRVGAADYIHKPFKPDVLLRRVDNIIDNLDKIHGLEEAATLDQLTKLLNKSAVQKKISEMIKTSVGVLLMIDLDSFKLVNDIYGHSIGDKILIYFAEQIRKIIRESDLAGRVGGDEFIAFLQNMDDEKVLQEKTKFLNEQILIGAKKLVGDDMGIPLGVSIGAVFVPDEGRDFQNLYEKADKALYNVKKRGKHGLAVFGEHGHAGNNLSGIEGISQMRMILSERNVEAGAYFVEFETFKKIYQMLSRMADSCKKNLTLVQFTLPEALVDEFKEILIHSLRKSDCVTRSGKKFLVLLTGASEEESEIVKDRIFLRFKKSFTSKISFEREKIF